MRILMLSQFYPPIIGGEAQHVQSLSVELVSRGHNITVVTLWHQGLAEFELDNGVQIYRIRSSLQRVPGLFSDNGRQHAPPFPDPELMLALRRLIRQVRPEIVHAHNWLVHSFLPLKAWFEVPLVVTLHSYNLVCAKTTLMFRQSLCAGPDLMKCLRCASERYGLSKGIPTVLCNRVMGLAEQANVDMFLAVSKAAAVGNGLVSKKLPFQIIPNFLSDQVEQVQSDCESYTAQLPADDYLLFVGAFNRQKGVDVLLRAYAKLTNAPPLVLIGYQTPDWPLLAKDCPDNVFVLKDWPHYAVMEAWRRSLIALAPSVGPETFGIGVMEAMSLGRPTIASRIGGLSDLVVDGETGILVEPGDASALQEAIAKLLENPALRTHMGQEALRKVVEFQACTVVPRIEHVYKELLHNAKTFRKSDVQSDSVATNGAL